MSKLDELMALADEYACEHGFLAMGHPDASKPIAANTRTALQDALKAVVEDAERYRWLADDCDGNAQDDFIQWLHGHVCNREQFDTAIDAARKPA